MKVALIPCGSSEWRKSGRLLGRVDLPLGDDGPAQCSAWAAALRSVPLSRILHSPDDLSRSTAQLLASELGSSTKAVTDLSEVDLGLWAGLTEEQLRSRYAKAHRQLVESPLRVSPPNGEDFSQAADRIRDCLRKRLKPNGKGIGLVMRPLTLAMAQCVLSGTDPSAIWESSRSCDGPVIVDFDGVPALVGQA